MLPLDVSQATGAYNAAQTDAATVAATAAQAQSAAQQIRVAYSSPAHCIQSNYCRLPAGIAILAAALLLMCCVCCFVKCTQTCYSIVCCCCPKRRKRYSHVHPPIYQTPYAPAAMMAQPGQLPPMPSWDDKPKPVPKYAEFPVEVEKPENAHHQSSQSPAENVHFGQAYTAARALQEQRKSPKPGPPHASASALAEYQDYGESAYSHAGYASPSSYNSTAKYQPAPPYDSYPAAYTSATNYSTPTRFSSHKNATAYSQARSGEYPPGQPSSARYGPQYSTQNSYDPHKLRSNDRNYPNPSSSPHYAPIPPRHAEPPRLKGPRINTTTAPQEGAYSNGQSAANYIDV